MDNKPLLFIETSSVINQKQEKVYFDFKNLIVGENYLIVTNNNRIFGKLIKYNNNNIDIKNNDLYFSIAIKNIKGISLIGKN